MGARILLWLFVLFIVGSGIGAIMDGAIPAGFAQFGVAVAILMFARWRRRRRAAIELDSYIRQNRVDYQRRVRRR